MINYSSSPQAQGRYSYTTNSPTTSPTTTPIPSPSSSYTTPYPASPRGSTSSGNTKRKQVKNACVNCQRACKKCDDQRPCSRCVKYGIEDGCVNSQRKERKRKSSNSEEQLPTAPKSLTSRRLTSQNQITAGTATTTTTASNNLTLRLSTRNGIRPFPKELLQSLQLESDSLDFDTTNDVHDEDEILFKSDPVQQIICPQVTDEFKTLAKICSDLHVVLAHPPPQPPQLLQTNYVPDYQQPMMFFHPQRPPIQPIQPIPLNSFCFTQNQQRQPSFSSLRPESPPLIQRRSISPTQMLLKPSSPIFNHQFLQLQLQLESQKQQQHLQQQMFYAGQVPTQTSHIQRDMMNRTPPEDDDQVHQVQKPHNCEHGCEH